MRVRVRDVKNPFLVMDYIVCTIPFFDAFTLENGQTASSPQMTVTNSSSLFPLGKTRSTMTTAQTKPPSSGTPIRTAHMALRRLAVGANVVLCNEATLAGEIVLGANTVVHPRSSILADTAPIILGKSNIVEERVVLRNTTSDVIYVGDENIFEVGCVVEAAKVGNQNVFEAKSTVHRDAVIGSNCVVGVGCVVKEGERLEDGTVVYGDGARRAQMTRDTAQASLHQRHLEYLREVLPKYNHLRQV